ncbi:MAG: COX15/CtaA family protein [Candidatus Velthaea sp.]
MFRTFSLAAAIAAFALAVLGSWIRINGAGMTCPDWPLCNGQIIPPLDGGVLLEWSHRMVAFLEGFLLIGAFVTGWQARKRIAYIKPVLGFIGAAFALQVFLGAATVALSNSPISVVWHWGTAMAFLGGLTALAMLAVIQPAAGSAPRVQTGLYGLLGTTTIAAFAAMCVGSYVSSSGAGLACTTFPACEGTWLGVGGGQLAQMLHRGTAGVFFVLATVSAYWAAFSTTSRVRVATLTGYFLIVVQIVLGIANVVWALPMPLREAHAANAGATFLAFVVAFALAKLDGTLRIRTAPAPPARAASSHVGSTARVTSSS